MKSKIVVPIVLLVIVGSIFATGPVFAQSSQVTSTVSLSHLNVQLTYPSQVLPGQSATINLAAQARDSFQLTSLTMQVYLADQNNLRQLLSTTLAQNTMMSSSNQINKQIQVTVPSDAPRTSLVALVTENVAAYLYSYASYPYWDWYWNGNSMTSSNWYNYGYPYYSYYYSYPSYGYQATSDNALAPLSYVQATTPEYVNLQQQYQQLQQQLNQTQGQNQQLQQQVQTLQNSNTQKDNTIANLNSQLSSTQGTTTLLGVIAVILAIVAVALAAVHFRPTGKSGSQTPTKQDTESTGA
jgi:predicted RND superfamily exporter protein